MLNLALGKRRSVSHSEKHEITWSNLADASASFTITIATGTKDVTAASEVRIGSIINAVYLEFNVNNDATTDMIFHWAVRKSPFGTTMTNSGTYDQVDKRFILKRGMEMLPASSSDSMLFKRIVVVKIPKKYQRMGDGDALELQAQKSSATATNFCGFAIFREQY